MAAEVVNTQLAAAGISGAEVQATLARIRDKHAVGRMLVTNGGDEDVGLLSRTLLDVAKLDGKELLAAYVKRHDNFATVPFDPTGARLKLYPGGVTIWSGYPGSGKTTLIRQLVCHTLLRGSSVFLASLEEDPENVLVNLAGTAAGAELPNAHQMQWFIDAYAERFRLWGQIGIADHKQILSAVRDLADKGVRHAVIDSLMCLDVPNDDTEAQRQFANLVSAVARVTKIHIHLVAHPRKLVSADQDLDINDVAGARELTGIADNVVFVRRDRNGEASRDDPFAPTTPMLIAVKKQRHGAGTIGSVSGWFHRSYRQFHLEQFQQLPTHYLPEDAYL